MGEELKEATSNYIDELNRLTEMLQKVSEQSQRLTRDSEEMENLNRTLTGISRVYEMQLKSASAQISTIDEINEQTRHMAEQIVELNKIYARMIEAMQVRMPVMVLHTVIPLIRNNVVRHKSEKRKLKNGNQEKTGFSAPEDD